MNSSEHGDPQLLLRGIVPPLVTPLTPAGDFDAGSNAKLIERVIEGGVHGLFVMGSTGEFSSFSSDVRRNIVQESCYAAGKRIPVVVNVSDTCLADSLRLTEFAARAGANAVAICPPFYFSVTQADLVRYLTTFAERAALPVFLYNIPQNAHHELTVETVTRLADVPNIVGLKNSNGSLEYLSKVCEIKATRPGFAILVGTEEILHAGDGGRCGRKRLRRCEHVSGAVCQSVQSDRGESETASGRNAGAGGTDRGRSLHNRGSADELFSGAQGCAGRIRGLQRHARRAVRAFYRGRKGRTAFQAEPLVARSYLKGSTMQTFRAALLAAATLFYSTLSFGQVNATGTFSGQVIDASGAAVPNAAVKVTEQETGIVTSKQTASDGYFTVALLKPGIYSIEVSASGFLKRR